MKSPKWIPLANSHPLIETFYHEVSKKFEELDIPLTEKEYQTLVTAYEVARMLFWDNVRDDGQFYFEHLSQTAHIVLYDFPNPTPDKVIIALLHDIIEDSKITYEMLKIIFWEKIAKKVKGISKPAIENYIEDLPEDLLEIYYQTSNDDELTAWQKMQCRMVKVKLKMLRNEEYFEHLPMLEDEELDVKFADRIHNLRTLCSYPWEKIIRKLQETLKYFLPLAEQRNPIAYKMLCVEVAKIQEYLQRLKMSNFQNKVKEILENTG